MAYSHYTLKLGQSSYFRIMREAWSWTFLFTKGGPGRDGSEHHSQLCDFRTMP